MTPVSRSELFPCITPESYLAELGEGNYVAWELGNGLVTMLWIDNQSMMQSTSPAKLLEIGVSEDEAWSVSLENLTRLQNENAIHIDKVGFAADESILVAGPHWLASALAVHTGFHEFAAHEIRSSSLCVALPSRDHAIFYSGNCSQTLRNAVNGIGEDLARSSRKPFGLQHFICRSDGPHPL